MIKKIYSQKILFWIKRFFSSFFVFILLSFDVDKSKAEQRKVTWKFNLLKKKKKKSLQSLSAQTVPVQM